MTKQTKQKKNLILVGPMGAGKSSVGRQLANKLHFKFIDSDQYIMDKTGTTIQTIFDFEGEAGFRQREKTAIAEICQQGGQVIATGGGAVLLEANQTELSQAGYIIYLHSSVEQLMQRLSKDTSRPLLQNDDPQAVLINLMQVRDPIYRQLADIVLKTEQRPIYRVVDDLIDLLVQKDLLPVTDR